MTWVTAALVLLSAILGISMAQTSSHQSYGTSYPGIDPKKHSGGYNTPHQTSYSPGSSPYGHKDQKGYGSSHKGGYGQPHNPHRGYGQPHNPHRGYGQPHNPHRGYGQPHNPHGGYGNPHGGYGGYNNPWKHYEPCYPDYTKYTPQQGYQLRYLQSADEETLNTNSSNFQAPPPVRGPSDVRCENGPKHILHTEKYEWHWPPIYKGTCDDLTHCRDPKCISTKTVKESACVLVFRHYGYRWIRVGYRKITYKTDKNCKCKQCRDIKSYRECSHEHPCPNEGTAYSYCYWKKPVYKNPYDEHDDDPHTPHDPHRPHDDKRPPSYGQHNSYDNKKTYDGNDRYDRYEDDKKKGYMIDPYDPYKHPLYPTPPGYCACCEPQLCKPPRKFDYDTCKCVCPKKKCYPGHKFNKETCKCECPEGTTFDKHKQKCIGKCKEVDVKACKHVLCKDNPQFYCKLDKKYKCTCPSCDDVDYWEEGLCKKTNCIEQKYKPNCVYDKHSGKCRCPECKDQKTPSDCEKTSCIDKYRQKYCKWVWYPYPSCQCAPPQYPPTPKYGHQTGYGNNKKSHGNTHNSYGNSHSSGYGNSHNGYGDKKPSYSS